MSRAVNQWHTVGVDSTADEEQTDPLDELAQLTRQLRTQLVRPGFRPREVLLLTTLLDPVIWPLETLAALYVRRWRVELYFASTVHEAKL